MTSLFASIEVAARIERAERTLIEDGARAAAARRPGSGVFVRGIGGGVAAWTSENSPFNKVAGVGFAPLDERELEEVEAAYAERKTPVQIELATLAEPGIARRLTARGYTLEGFENVLARRLPIDRPPMAKGIAIEEARELEPWLDVVVAAFASPDTQGVPSHEEFPREALERVLGDMAASPANRRYLVKVEGKIAAAGGMRVSDRIAQMTGAGTLPAARRRGAQSALLVARLWEASEAGCELAVITTLPGSKSQQNVQRQGFELLFARAVLRRVS